MFTKRIKTLIEEAVRGRVYSGITKAPVFGIDDKFVVELFQKAEKVKGEPGYDKETIREMARDLGLAFDKFDVRLRKCKTLEGYTKAHIHICGRITNPESLRMMDRGFKLGDMAMGFNTNTPVKGIILLPTKTIEEGDEDWLYGAGLAPFKKTKDFWALAYKVPGSKIKLYPEKYGEMEPHSIRVLAWYLAYQDYVKYMTQYDVAAKLFRDPSCLKDLIEDDDAIVATVAKKVMAMA